MNLIADRFLTPPEGFVPPFQVISTTTVSANFSIWCDETGFGLLMVWITDLILFRTGDFPTFYLLHGFKADQKRSLDRT